MLLQKLVMQPMRSALALTETLRPLLNVSRQNKHSCFDQNELPRNTILNMRSPVTTGDFGGLIPPKQNSKPPKLKRETL